MRATVMILILCMGWIAVWLPAAEASEPMSPPSLSAQAAVLVDVQSNRVLFAKNADNRMRIASLTKIMTAIVAIENGRLGEKVKVGPRAAGVEGSSIYLKEGEEIPLEHLLYGLMLRSGNDAAVAIAEHIGGSLNGFVYMMNEKAEYLGLEGTHFENPHGLDAPEHYSTARDVAKLTAYALKNPTFRKIVGTQVKTVPWPGEQWHRKWYNKNKMLRLFPGGDGVKTGYTKLSKRTLVSSATRDGRQLACVTLNAPDDWNDSMFLLEYGFREFTPESLVHKGEVMADIPGDEQPALAVVTTKGFRYPLRSGEEQEISVKPMITYPLAKVRKEGTRVGTARIYLKGKPIGSVPLEVKKKPAEDTALGQWLSVLAYMVGRGG
ncbi:D-alanyl-D-alanine carboxypeptidase DacB [Marinithermofilum abyssi]|uniref:serine-type D-Ala-D-Ala carboxypeptidase n=1 Tax=Marinithermofilum abyssi TaxID=1571185 RepID=A0A8J2YCR2_9BACL|nr:D-alanyl-D-alanine carboxypeptidase family protein [Marinithermofilum abyssi]GGE10968.1 D-alanyl-D-alanine carboxypeptidase DacB [Marinithermofilum abyssi]